MQSTAASFRPAPRRHFAPSLSCCDGVWFVGVHRSAQEAASGWKWIATQAAFELVSTPTPTGIKLFGNNLRTKVPPLRVYPFPDGGIDDYPVSVIEHMPGLAHSGFLEQLIQAS